MKYLRLKWMKAIITAALMLSAGICYSCSHREEGGFYGIQEETLILSGEGPSVQDGPSDSAPGDTDEVQTQEEETEETGPQDSREETKTMCFVHISGAVWHPGVYELEEGSRIYQAVEAAGGFLPEADEGYLNLAALIADGMKITVLTKEEAQSAGAWEADEGGSGQQKETVSEKVNINTATKDQLMTLTGIGEVRAEDIIAYRQEHGPFRQIEDIMQVSGIKEAAFAKIKDDITV